MNRTYEDMSKKELVTLVKRLAKQHDEWSAEAKRLREQNELLRKADWEYECLWTWLAENTNLLNTIEPLIQEWKKELIE